MNNLNNEIYKKYNSQLTKKTRIKINELNSNLYGMGCESDGFEFIKYKNDVSNEINNLQESYYDNFSDVWYESLNDDVNQELQDDSHEIYHIDIKTIKQVLLGSELANII